MSKKVSGSSWFEKQLFLCIPIGMRDTNFDPIYFPIRFALRYYAPFSRETCSILVDQSYYHALYLGRSKDVVDLCGAKFRRKNIRRFVEALPSHSKIALSTKIIISIANIFSKDLSENLNVRCMTQREKRPRRSIAVLSNISKHNGLHVGALLRHYFRCVIRL